MVQKLLLNEMYENWENVCAFVALPCVVYGDREMTRRKKKKIVETFTK